MKLVTVGEMQELERRAEAAGVPTTQLMENAGLAFARSVRASLGGAADRHIVALIGSGNNGGDGLVAARHLADWGAAVTLFLTAPRRDDDRNYRRCKTGYSPSMSWLSPLSSICSAETLASADAVLDAVLGTGRARPIVSPAERRADNGSARGRPQDGDADHCPRLAHRSRRRHRRSGPRNPERRPYRNPGVPKTGIDRLSRRWLYRRARGGGHRNTARPR